MTSFILISLSTWLQGPFHVHFPGEKLVGIACHKTVNMNMETILKVRGPKPKLHSEANAIYKTCLWISQILTTSCYGLPATLASLASSEVVKLQSIAFLILHCIWLLLTYRLIPIWTLKVFTCLSSAPRQMVRPFPTGLLCLPWSWSCPSVLWFPWEITFTFMGWNTDLYFLTWMVLLFSDPALCILKIDSEVSRCSWKFIWSYL